MSSVHTNRSQIFFVLFANIILMSIPTIYANERISVTSNGFQSNLPSAAASISADGRYITFTSDFAFVAQDINGVSDVYIHDTVNNTTELVSFNNTNTNAGNSISFQPEISANGEIVAFTSYSTDLTSITSMSNLNSQVYVRNLENDTTELISFNSLNTNYSNDSSIRPVVSADGRYIAFSSFASDIVVGDTNNISDVFIRDRMTDTTDLVSFNQFNNGPGNLDSVFPSISANGRLVAFQSDASDLIPSDLNSTADVFVRDLETDTTELISISVAGIGPGTSFSFSPSISADGRYIAFASEAVDLVFLDTNGSVPDIFLRDRQTNITRLISLDTGGGGSNNASSNPMISDDGRFISFTSQATDLVTLLFGDGNGERDIFTHDTQTGITYISSVIPSSFTTANNASLFPAIDANGGAIAYQSLASDLITGDTNGVLDVFVDTIFAPSGPIVSSTLPDSRSVEVGTKATAFASIINTAPSQTAINCGLRALTDIPATFIYQQIDAAGMPIDEINQGADIPGANGIQGYVFGFTPTAAFAPTEIEITYDCANSDPASIFVGLNTLLLSASVLPIPDIIALTTETDLVAPLGITSLYAVGSTNLGITGDITVSLDTGSTSLPINLLFCQTNPGTGACLPTSPPSPSTTFTYTGASSASFAVFVEPTATIDNDPANNRIFIRFEDNTSTIRGATSTAVRTQ